MRCEVCAPHLVEDDDVLLVAGMRMTQRATLLEAGIDSVTALAESAGPVDGIAASTMAALRRQARLQVQGRSADVPPFDRASMDGYAVIAADTAGATRESPRRLRLAGRVYTGDVPTESVAAGACMEIATGAPMPDGANAVIMVEETAVESDRVSLFAAVRPAQNVGPRGADISAGQSVLDEGDVLNASRIGALAALGRADVAVWARPSVAVLSTTTAGSAAMSSSAAAPIASSRTPSNSSWASLAMALRTASLWLFGATLEKMVAWISSPATASS